MIWRRIRAVYRMLNIATNHVLGAIVKILIAAYFVFCLIFLTLRYGILPNIERYKGDVELAISHSIGKQVSIGSISASWQGLSPKLFLGDVVIHDKDGRAALSLPGVSATVSWWSVVVADVRLHHLEIRKPEMDIERDADGKLYVAGILVDVNKSGDGKGADWILSQREIVILDGSLRWNDRMRKAPELALTGMNLILRNRWQRHEFVLRAIPPAQFAAPIDIRADFFHQRFANRISDFSQWTGELYADLNNTDLAVWKPYFTYPIELDQGKGAVRAWLEFNRARIANFTADLTLTDVLARLHKDLPTLDLVRVSGRVSVSAELARHGKPGEPGTATFGVLGHAISLTDFSLETRDGLVLPTTTISETYVPATKDQPEKTAIKAKLLDLRTLADFAERLPIPAAQRQMLNDFSPRGMLTDFSLRWSGSYPDISDYDIKGRFVDLSVKAQAARPARPKSAGLPAQAAVPAIPGVENLTGDVKASDSGGSFNLESKQVKFLLPTYFIDPELLLDELTMQAVWTFQEKDQLLLDVRKMAFVQRGLSGSFSGTHLMPLAPSHGKPLGHIDVSGTLNGFALDTVGQYLPLSTPAALRGWLTGALVGGVARDVKIRLRGNLADFPFRTERPGDKPRGEFSVVGKIENGALDYAPGKFGKDGLAPLWPLLEQVNGSFAFDRTRMQIKGESAMTNGVALSGVTAVVQDLASPERQLDIDGNAAGKLQNFLQYVGNSPVTGWIAGFTEETKGSGDAKLALKLQLPLTHMIDSKVQGTLQFADNDVVLQTAIPLMSRTSGKLEFNEKGLNLNGVRTNFLGGPAVITGGTQRDGSIAIKADGNVTAEGLAKAYASPAMQKLMEHVSGGTRFGASINVRNKRPEIVIESSLQGMALNLPAPLNKAANDVVPLKFDLSALTSDDASLRDEIRIGLGPAIFAHYLRQKSPEKNAEWRVLRGGIGINASAPQPDSGLGMNFNMKSLNFDAWSKLASSLGIADSKKGSGATSDAPDIAQYLIPEVIAARATELILLGKKLDNVVVGASHQNRVWQANIDASQASGYVTWNESPSGRGLGKVTMRMASLIIPKSAATDVTELLEGKNEATEIPGLDISVEEFELFGKKFGNFELLANNMRVAGSREWHISKLSIVNPDAELKATGKWTSKGGASLSSLNYALDIANAGALLERFGFANAIRGGKGKMTGDLNWNGLPFSLDIPSLSGHLSLDLAAGQFLRSEPGAGRLLGVLSLQSLPRRLTLDFRDVFSEGFAFDGITGMATILQGVASTENFKMRGLSATVLMDGVVDIAKESQNLHVVVIPDFNAGTASIMYGLLVNPIIGVGTFLAQLVLRDPLMRALTREYKMTGSWTDPVFTEIENASRRAKASTANAEKAE
ncbi:YhdP family protein [soil metagenome]